MAREPAKNCINMHDIISQPLGSLPDAVHAVLRRPDALDPTEIRSIFTESPYLFLRAEEALSACHMAGFEALMRLFSEGLTHDESSFEEGVQTIVLQPTILQSLENLFRSVVQACTSASSSASTETGSTMNLNPPTCHAAAECTHRALWHDNAVVELTQVMGSLCDAEALKDRCGEAFMPGLAQLLQFMYRRPDEAQDYFRLSRSIATALINLVKGSRANKMRLSSWTFVAVCCVASVDVFFQLQCVELLFRVSRQRRQVLTEVESVMTAAHVQMLRTMPNDGSLLTRMMQLVKSFHQTPPCAQTTKEEDEEEKQPQQPHVMVPTSVHAHSDAARGEGEKGTLTACATPVLCYPLTRVTAAETVVTEATDAYFTRGFVVVMVTTSSADNITLPYVMIRSITLGKDGRVTIRLSEFPAKLETLLSAMPGMDTLTLHMSPRTLNEFKQSSVRAWIVRALHKRKMDQQQQQQQHEEKSAHISSRKRTLEATPPPMTRTEAVHESHDVCDARHDALNETNTAATEVGAKVAESGDRRVLRPLSTRSLAPTDAARVGETDSDLMAATQTLAREQPSTCINHVKAASTIASTSASTSAAAGHSNLTHVSDALNAAQSYSGSVHTHRAHTRSRQSTEAETDALLQQLRRVAAAKLELRRVQMVDGLNECMSEVQSSVDATRRGAREVRRAWQQEALTEVSRMAATIAEAQEATVAAVSQLNDHLHAIKVSNQAIQDRIAGAEVEVQHTLDASRQAEEETVRELRLWREREAMRCEVALGGRLLARGAVWMAAGSLVAKG